MAGLPGAPVQHERTAAAAGVDLIAVEGGKTLILDRGEVLRLCQEAKISVVALV